MITQESRLPKDNNTYISRVSVIPSKVLESALRKFKEDFLPRDLNKRKKLVVKNFTKERTMQREF